MRFPSVINNFRMYKKGTVLVGVAEQVTLPQIVTKTATINGAGFLGDFDESVLGQTDNITMEISFRTLSDDVFKLVDPSEGIELTLRGAIQVTDLETCATDVVQLRIVVRGKSNDITLGDVKIASQMGSKIKLNLNYIKIEVDGKEKMEIDKFNSIFSVDGVDLLKKVRNMC